MLAVYVARRERTNSWFVIDPSPCLSEGFETLAQAIAHARDAARAHSATILIVEQDRTIPCGQTECVRLNLCGLCLNTA